MTSPAPDPRFVYEGDRARHIAFPLGGIGAGGMSLSGSGRLIDWSIRNRPGLQSFNGYSHFAIKAEQGGKLLDARVLNGPYEGTPTGSPSTRKFFDGFGFGANRNTLTGVPHFRATTFTGRFPVAEIDFHDERFPGAVRLIAWSPFIPTNERDSSFPAAMFEIEVTNTTPDAIDYTIGGTLGNHGCQNGVHAFSGGVVKSLRLTARDEVEDWRAGDLTIATDADDVDHMDYHFRGQWFDDLNLFWREFAQAGRLPKRHYETPRLNKNMFDQPEHATLASRITVSPGEAKRVKFAIAWHFPVGQVYWRPEAIDGKTGTWRNYYASQWADSSAVLTEAFARWDELRGATFVFRDTLFGTTLPTDIVDAVQGTMSILRTGTVIRLDNGELWAWEGQFTNEGSCEGSCTHVWNYQQTLPYLFPALERSLRDTDFAYNQLPNGGLTFRQIVPLGSGLFPLNPCADGQFGSIIKTFRDWKISGDTAWLKELWPKVRAALEYAWSADNPDQWDPVRTGILWGRQHHTLDMELFGPNSWLSTMYVAALKAGALMARAADDVPLAVELDRMGDAGARSLNNDLFNGEYFIQSTDLGDRSRIETFDQAKGKVGVLADNFMETYWSDEYGEMKYQLGHGCASDQILGQWHADLCGLPGFLDAGKVTTALGAIHKHNYRPTLADHFNPCRVYAYEDEGGLLIATWPEGTTKPAVPAPYSEEVWTGIEYAVASHMILRGLVDEGLAVVASARARHDGHRRNPWNDIECGSYYARSMSSFALVNAWSRFSFDMTAGVIGFDPVRGGDGIWLWSVGEGWGVVSRTGDEVTLEVRYGRLALETLSFAGTSTRVGRTLNAGDSASLRIGG